MLNPVSISLIVEYFFSHNSQKLEQVLFFIPCQLEFEIVTQANILEGRYVVYILGYLRKSN